VKGPDIAISNGGLTVTRTDSSGWGTAIFAEPMSACKAKITFNIDNHGDTDYLYIGFMDAAGKGALSNALNASFDHPLWTWKRNGEFHSKSGNT
jgi:hypothetical protein